MDMGDLLRAKMYLDGITDTDGHGAIGRTRSS